MCRTLFFLPNLFFNLPHFGEAPKSITMLIIFLMALGLLAQQWKWNNYRTLNLRYRTKKNNEPDHFI